MWNIGGREKSILYNNPKIPYLVEHFVSATGAELLLHVVGRVHAGATSQNVRFDLLDAVACKSSFYAESGLVLQKCVLFRGFWGTKEASKGDG